MRIVVFFGHVASNVGDLAINTGTVRLLTDLFPGADIHVVLASAASSVFNADAIRSLGNSPRVTFSHFSFSDHSALLSLADPGAFLGSVEAGSFDLLVMASGEHLFGYETLENDRSLFWRALPAMAANLVGKPCVILPSTFGPFESPISAALARELLNSAEGWSVRDTRSGDLVRDLCGGEPALGIDPAFFLDPPQRRHEADATSRPRSLGLVMRSEQRGISVSQDKAAPTPDEADSAAFRFGTEIGAALLADPDVRLRLFVQTEADRALTEKLAATFEARGFGGRIAVEIPSGVEDYLARLAELDGLVTTRLHAAILALVAGVRPVAGYFDEHGHKMPGLFANLSIPELCFRINEFTGADIEAMARLAREGAAPDAALRRIEELKTATAALVVKAASPQGGQARSAPDLRPLLRLAMRLEARSAAAKVRYAVRKSETKWASNLKASEAEAGERIKGLQGRVATVKAETAAAHEALAAATSALRAAKAMDRIMKKRAKIKDERLAKRRSELADLRRSDAYQAGLALKFSVQQPWPNLPMLPWRLLRLAFGRPLALSDAARRRKPATQKPKARVIGDDVNTLIVEARNLRAQGDTQAEIGVLQKAARLETSERTLRALYWAAMNAGEVDLAFRTFGRLKARIGDNPSPDQRDRLERLARNPVMRLAALDLVRPRSRPPETSVGTRVAYVLHNSLPYSSGGYATRAQGLALGLAATGLEPVCLTRPGFPFDIKKELDPATTPELDMVEGVAYHRCDDARYTGAETETPYIEEASRILERKFFELRPGVVMAASNHVTALPALIAARRFGAPFIYEVRGLWEVTRQSREPEFERSAAFNAMRRLEAAVAFEADAVITLIEPMRDELVARGVPAEKIHLAPNSVDPARFTPRPRDAELAARIGVPAGTPVIGYVGSFVQYEGLEDLTTACARLKAADVDFRLLLVGNENASGQDRGPITEEIERIARESGLSDRLIMPGRVPHEDVEAWYSLIDIAPFPRKPQPVTEMVSPIKPLEALAMEKAVVVSSVRALAEMIRDGETGVIFDKGDTDSLADALARLIGDPALRERLGRAGREWVLSERTWDRTAAGVRAVLDGVMAQAAREEAMRP